MGIEIDLKQQAEQEAAIDLALRQCGANLEYTASISLKSIIYLVNKLNSPAGSHVKSLEFAHGNLEGEVYAKELAKLQHVTALNFSHNGVNTAGAIALLQNPVFKKLNLSNSYFKYHHPELLAAVLANNTLAQLKVDLLGFSETMRQQIDDHFKEKRSALPSSSNGARFEFAEKHLNHGVSVLEGTAVSSPTNGHS